MQKERGVYEATKAQIGKQIGIYMDDTLISNPVVNSAITGGQAEITGMDNYERAKDLSDKINAGALPFLWKQVIIAQSVLPLGRVH